MKYLFAFMLIVMCITTFAQSPTQPGELGVNQGQAFQYLVDIMNVTTIDAGSVNSVDYLDIDGVDLHEKEQFYLIVNSLITEYDSFQQKWIINTDWSMPGGNVTRFINFESFSLISHTNWTHIEQEFVDLKANNIYDFFDYTIMDETDTFGYTETVIYDSPQYYFSQVGTATYHRVLGYAIGLEIESNLIIGNQQTITHYKYLFLPEEDETSSDSSGSNEENPFFYAYTLLIPVLAIIIGRKYLK